MESIAQLLDAAKRARNLGTDMALAEALGVTRAAVSHWRSATHLPDAVQVAKIADLAGVPLARAIGIVGGLRAHSTAEKAVWRRLASAAALMLGFAAASYTGSAQAPPSTGPGMDGPLRIMSRWFRRSVNYLQSIWLMRTA